MSVVSTIFDSMLNSASNSVVVEVKTEKAKKSLLTNLRARLKNYKDVSKKLNIPLSYADTATVLARHVVDDKYEFYIGVVRHKPDYILVSVGSNDAST